MLIYSNLYSADKTYDTLKDIGAIKRIINEAIASDRNTIASSGTLIKQLEVIKFKDGSWLKKGSLLTLSEQRNDVMRKVEKLGIVKIIDGTVIMKNKDGLEKKYTVSDPEGFEKLMIVLDFTGELEICRGYKIVGVSTDKRIPYEQRTLKDKYFFEGEEVKLIEWAAKNKIWHWLKEVEE